jgi:hypothetical protein
MTKDAVTLKENELKRIRKEIADIKHKIEKRREALETKGSTVLARKKDESRIEAIENKITTKTVTVDKTIEYYKTEIQKAEQKMEDDKTVVEKKMENEITILRQKLDVEIERLQRKYDVEKKKVEDKFYNYRTYCMTFISSMEEKRALLTDPLEKKKETIQMMMDKTEDDDAYLVGYKIDLRKLLEEEKTAEEGLVSELRYAEEQREQRRKTAEFEARLELQRHQQEQEAKDARDRELLFMQRQQEKAADEERWAQRKEQEKKQRQEEEVKKQQKETAYSQRSNFINNLYPTLSEKSKDIYQFLKKDIEARHKEIWTLESKEECEEFLKEFEEDYDMIQDYEENYLSSLSSEQQSVFLNKTIPQKIKYIQFQGKKDKEKKKPTSKSVIALSSLPPATR